MLCLDVKFLSRYLGPSDSTPFAGASAALGTLCREIREPMEDGDDEGVLKSIVDREKSHIPIFYEAHDMWTYFGGFVGSNGYQVPQLYAWGDRDTSYAYGLSTGYQARPPPNLN